MKKKLHVLVINEFNTTSSPVSALAIDLCDFLNKLHSCKATIIYVSKKYHPGGLGLKRLRNFLLLHLSFPCVLTYWRVRTWWRRERLLLLSTTNPPFIHWSAVWWGKIFCIPAYIWYQDAHPGLENYFFRRRNIYFLPTVLDFIDRHLLHRASGIVALDKAMAVRLSAILQGFRSVPKTQSIPPWATYMEPAKPIRVPDFALNKIKLLYAGNYGFAHSLEPLKACLAEISAEYLRNLQISFVGMNETAQKSLRELFSNLPCDVQFMPRFANVRSLCDFMTQHDLGIVSLRYDYAGYACPSKALTYLSQGLPILYIGPDESLSDELVKQGYGMRLHKAFFENPNAYLSTLPLAQKADKVFPNPAFECKQAFQIFLETSEL